MLSKSSKRKKPIRGLGEKPMVVALAPQLGRNAERTRENFARAYGEEYRAWIVAHRCILFEITDGACSGVTEPAHTGGGGTGYKGDKEHLAPICSGHHAESGQHGVKTFERKYSVDLKATARRYWQAYQDEQSAEHDNDD